MECSTSICEKITDRADRKEEQGQEHHSCCADQKHMEPIDPLTEPSLSHYDNAPFVQTVMASAA